MLSSNKVSTRKGHRDQGCMMLLGRTSQGRALDMSGQMDFFNSFCLLNFL